MRLDLLSFRVFLSVVEEGNIGRAAEREHIAASAISKRIQDLEAELGVRLLYRHVKGVTPTSAGEALTRHLRSLFAIVDRIKGELSEHAEGNRGRVIVHANGSAIVEFLATDLKAFGAEHPAVQVDLHEHLSPAVVRAVHEGVADLGVYDSAVEAPADLEVRPYRQDRLLAVLPREHPLAGEASLPFEALLDYEIISTQEGSSIAWLLNRAARKLNRPIRAALAVGSNEVVRCMVDAGRGIAILPEGFVKPYEGLLAIRGVPLSDRWAKRQLAICLRDPAGLTTAARRLLARLEAGG